MTIQYMALTYPKIQTVYLRDPETKYRTLLEGQFSLPEFEYLQHCRWEFTEKIDGTNIRVNWDALSHTVWFEGRKAKSQIPAPLMEYLTDTFTPAAMDGLDTMTIYGEGYGAGIQKAGSGYIPGGVGFIVFDIRAGSGMPWLEVENTVDIASRLGVPHVPVVRTGTLHMAVDMARNGFASLITDSGLPAEGLVMRTNPILLDRQGNRIITKIKCKDFAK